MMNPAIQRYYWENAVAVFNLETLGVSPKDIIILYTKGDDSVSHKLESQFGITTYTYPDLRPNEAKAYIPSIRPYLWWQFTKDQTWAQTETFMYQDSDIVYRQIPNLNKVPATPNHFYGADVESYVGPAYFHSKGDKLVSLALDTLGITQAQFEDFRGVSVGAQWVISAPRPDYWQDVYETSYKLYDKMVSDEPRQKVEFAKEGRPNEFPFQSWVSEMIAQLYLTAKYGITTEKSEELNFNWSSDHPKDLSKHILHNAGVTRDMARDNKLFFKGKYVMSSPFDENIDWVNPDWNSHEYATWVMRTKKYIDRFN